MAKKTKPISSTLVTFLLDRTGSMQAIKPATIEAFNGYKNGLKDSGIKLSLAQFDHYNGGLQLDKTYVDTDPKDAPDLTNETFQPRGSTPLIDAAYAVIKAVEAKVESLPKDTKVVICIQTDGEENASREHTWEQLAKLIEDKQAFGWQFNFMGAGIDAYQQGAKMGLSAASTMSYDSADLLKTKAAFYSRARDTRLYASGATAAMSISANDKKAAGDAFDLGLRATPTETRPKKEAFKL